MEDLLTRPAPAPGGAASPSVAGPGARGLPSWPRCRPRSGPPARPRRRADAASTGSSPGATSTPLLLVTLAALALVLHGRTLWTSYWGDEAIAVGIAAHPLGSLPHYLVDDGSPPLYYVALHYWMRIVRAVGGGHPRPLAGPRPARHTGGLVVGGTGSSVAGRPGRRPDWWPRAPTWPTTAPRPGCTHGWCWWPFWPSPASSSPTGGRAGATGWPQRCSWRRCFTSSTTACTSSPPPSSSARPWLSADGRWPQLRATLALRRRLRRPFRPLGAPVPLPAQQHRGPVGAPPRRARLLRRLVQRPGLGRLGRRRRRPGRRRAVP